jgi:EAL domain-containing protein (putative c-di-GMP-specific phosphodiesterase class I)
VSSNYHSSLSPSQSSYPGTIHSVFQPIFSPRTKNLVGYEALSRFTRTDGVIEQPDQVFRRYRSSLDGLTLDRACRQTALESYLEEYRKFPDRLLFLNFDSTIIDLGVQGSGYLLHQVEQLGIPSNRIVLEIIESQVSQVQKLMDFVDKYRNHGFFIALDDVGSGYSNLERLAQIQPHIIKIDRSIIKDIDQSYAKEKIFQAIIQLSHNLGSLALAEGIETSQEALTCIELGADLVQGYFFSEPASLHSPEPLILDPLDQVLDRYSDRYVQMNESQRTYLQTLETATRDLARQLKHQTRTQWSNSLLSFLTHHRKTECAYILDTKGIQVTETFFRQPRLQNNNPLFFPGKVGTDHSAKPYFLQGRRTTSFILSDSYISLATGKVCQTLVLPFRTVNHKSYRLCLDIPTDTKVTRE